MLLCVILVWPTKFENSFNYMQNVFETWKFQENCLTILFLGKLGSKEMFLKNISSHTHAFLFIKFNALMSFCINLLCFSIFFFLKNFDWSNLFLDWSKLQLKFWSASICFNWCSIGVGLIETFSINQTYFSINRKSYWDFFFF